MLTLSPARHFILFCPLIRHYKRYMEQIANHLSSAADILDITFGQGRRIGPNPVMLLNIPIDFTCRVGYNINDMGVVSMRLYLETTMFNYYFDTERDGHTDTVRLFEAIRAGEYEAYTSEYAVGELLNAQEPKQSKMLALIEEYDIAVLPITDESNQLADIYISEGIIPPRFRLDGAQIAISAIHGLDYVLSYNFQHINRAKTKLLTDRINNKKGYSSVLICTAKEVLEDEYNDEE